VEPYTSNTASFAVRQSQCAKIVAGQGILIRCVNASSSTIAIPKRFIGLVRSTDTQLFQHRPEPVLFLAKNLSRAYVQSRHREEAMTTLPARRPKRGATFVLRKDTSVYYEWRTSQLRKSDSKRINGRSDGIIQEGEEVFFGDIVDAHFNHERLTPRKIVAFRTNEGKTGYFLLTDLQKQNIQVPSI
jgi:hypothetical protein